MKVSETSDLEGSFLEKTAERRAGMSGRFTTGTLNEAFGRSTLSLARGMMGRAPDLPKPMVECAVGELEVQKTKRTEMEMETDVWEDCVESKEDGEWGRASFLESRRSRYHNFASAEAMTERKALESRLGVRQMQSNIISGRGNERAKFFI